jgi:hypothetical protein
MIWEWSHTAEAYENVRKNIGAKDREWLEVVYAEWEARKGNHLDQKKYERALKKAKKFVSDVIVEYIFEKAQE